MVRAGLRSVGAGLTALVTAVALGATAVPAAANSTTVTLSGTVLGEDGVAVAGAEVRVSPEGGGSVLTATAAADGSYRLTGVPAGSWRVSASDPRPAIEAEYVAENWDGTTSSPTFWDAVELTGPTVANFSLDHAHGVIVSAVDEAGTPLPGLPLVWERLIAETGEWQPIGHDSPVTGADGVAYQSVLPGQPYRFCFRDANYSRDNRPELRYHDACYGGVDMSSATPVAAGPEDRKVEISIELEAAGLSLWHEYGFVHGSHQVGQPLTAEPGQWGPVPVALTYAWGYYEGSSFVAIPGATAATYRPTADLAGRYLYVRITGSAPDHVTATEVVNAGTVGGRTPTISSFTLSGSATAGTVVTARLGTTSPAGANTELSWYADGELLVGEYGRTLAITAETAGAAISAKLRVYDFTFGEESDYDEELYAFAALRGTLSTAVPTISGDARVGGTLVAAAGTWGPAPVALTYQWRRDGVAIPGATSARYTVTAADDRTGLTVAVTGARYLYTSATTVSAATRIGSTITPGRVTLTAPTTPKPRDLLTVSTSGWSAGTQLTYQWYRGSVAISGATSTQYRVRPEDGGYRLFVVVTGRKPGEQQPVRVESNRTGFVYTDSKIPIWRPPTD